MAPTLSFYIVLALAISAQGSLGSDINCENLNHDSCSFAVSSNGKRCVLEKGLMSSEYTCRTSEIEADRLRDWVETDECVEACGVERKSLGISSDSLLDRSFADSLCSNRCYDNCRNIVDLYFNLAAGEGLYLPKFCQARRSSRRRELLIELNSNGAVAESPIGSTFGGSKLIEESDESPSPSPSPSPSIM